MRTILIASVLALGTAGAQAQDDSRYTLQRTDDGYVRMDKMTGAMSICTERSGQLVCKLAADEREALQADMEEMQDRLDGLEKRLAALETGRQDAVGGLPTEDEFEKSLSYMERFFRSFMGIVREFEREEKPAPERT